MAASYRKTSVLEFLFNSEYCEIFKSAYFEEHKRTATSENVFMKLRKIKIYKFKFYIKKRSKVQAKNISCERALNFDQ